MRPRNAVAVGAQSVEVLSASASFTMAVFVALASDWSPESLAKCARRRRSKLLRAAEKRFQSACSVPRSTRGATFHSSSSTRSRSPDAFQLVDSARPSASTTIASRAALAASLARDFAARASARRASRAGVSAATRARRLSMSPTAWGLPARPDPFDRRRGLVDRDVRTARQTLLEQDDLGLERDVLPHVVGERLVGRPGLELPDLHLARAGAHPHGSVVLDPAERLGQGVGSVGTAGHGGGGRCGRVRDRFGRDRRRCGTGSTGVSGSAAASCSGGVSGAAVGRPERPARALGA